MPKLISKKNNDAKRKKEGFFKKVFNKIILKYKKDKNIHCSEFVTNQSLGKSRQNFKSIGCSKCI